jgi:UDP-2,3-diacylglucosamine pyrophosphatase LpxH
MKMNNIQRQRESLEWALDNLKTGFIPSDKQERDRHNRILRRVKDGDCSDENRDLVEEIVNILFGLPESMNDDVCVSSSTFTPKSDESRLDEKELEDFYVIFSSYGMSGLLQHFPQFSKRDIQELIKELGITRDNPIPEHILLNNTIEDAHKWLVERKRELSSIELNKRRLSSAESSLRKLYASEASRTLDIEQIERLMNDVLERRGMVDTGSILAESTRSENTSTVKKQKPLYVAISDIHFGKKDSGVKGSITNAEILRDRIMKIADYINQLECSRVEIFIVGDLLESPMPSGMHAEQQKRMDLLSGEQIVYAQEVLTQMMLRVREVHTHVNVRIIGGNHDRFGIDRSDDIVRTGAFIVASMLATRMNDLHTGVNVTYAKGGIIRHYDEEYDINVIAFHGDNNVYKRKPLELHNMYAENCNANSIIMTGHFHNFSVNETHRVCRVTLGAICSNDSYEYTQVGVANIPSFFVFTPSDNGMFDYSRISL